MIHTEGFVIKSMKYKEYDRLYTMLTKEHGKITVRGRGVRKPLSKFGAHLQLLNPLQLDLIQGKAWYTLRSLIPITNYQLPTDTNVLEAAYFLGYVLHKSLPDHYTNEMLYTNLTSFYQQYILASNIDEQISIHEFKLQAIHILLKDTGHWRDHFEKLSIIELNRIFQQIYPKPCDLMISFF
jgi:DNA repair protein RecO (recombination protein O)